MTSNTPPSSFKAQSKELLYYFTPAALLSNFSPLLIILDEKDSPNPIHFEYKMWNILTPVGTVDSNLLQSLIEYLAQEYACEGHIYFYAHNSMTQFTMTQAFKAKANALYIDEPFKGQASYLYNLLEFLKQEQQSPIFYFGQEAPCKNLETFVAFCRKNHLPCQVELSKPLQNRKEKIIDTLTFLEKQESQI